MGKKCPHCKKEVPRKPGTTVAEALFYCADCKYTFCIVEEQTPTTGKEEELRQENKDQADEIANLKAIIAEAKEAPQ